jgi:type III secretion system low calcium response chaperone LcrH/SycD
MQNKDNSESLKFNLNDFSEDGTKKLKENLGDNPLKSMGFDVENPEILAYQIDNFNDYLQYYILSPEVTGDISKKEYVTCRKIQKKLKHAINQMDRKGLDFKSAMGIDQSYVEALYEYTITLYKNGNYKKAITYFENLKTLCSKDKRFFFATGACYQMMKEYKKAISNYLSINVLDATDPLPHYHSIECALQLNDYGSALVYIGMVLTLTKNREGYEALYERCLYLKGYFTKELFKMNKKKKNSKKKKKKNHKES